MVRRPKWGVLVVRGTRVSSKFKLTITRIQALAWEIEMDGLAAAEKARKWSPGASCCCSRKSISSAPESSRLNTNAC